MKRIAALFLIVCMAVALFAGCGTQKTTPINIGALKGPTGMGMVTLMGRKIFLLKPTTFMNLSGNAVRYWLNQEKIDQSRLLVDRKSVV